MKVSVPVSENLKLSSHSIKNIERRQIADISDIAGQAIYTLTDATGTFDFAFLPKPTGADRLYVLFSGAADRTMFTPPVFQRWSWANHFPGHCLYISDPTLLEGEDISLGWYIGCPESEYFSWISTLVHTLADRMGVARQDIVFYGSSGGGFAALAALVRTPEAATVAINPQIRLTAFLGNSLRKILDTCYGGISKAEFAERYPEKNSIRHLSDKIAQSRILYVQCRQDEHHIEKHLSELISLDGEAFSSDRLKNLDMLFFDDPRGHAYAEPKELLPDILKRLDAMTEQATSPVPVGDDSKPAKAARTPTKFQSLVRLRELRVPVETVLDVGVMTGTGELMKLYGDKPHVLIEPVEEWNAQIRSRYDQAGINYRIVNAAAAGEDGQMNIALSSARPQQKITHSRLTTETEGDNLRKVDVLRLDTFLPAEKIAGPYLLKIDVDGAELDVLSGAEGILEQTSIIVIEAQVRNFKDRMLAVMQHGFQLFDIVDLCYYDRRLNQVDLVFLNDEMIARHDLDMFTNGFDISRWYAYLPKIS